MKKCSLCGKLLSDDSGTDCPECGATYCDKCKENNKNICSTCLSDI